MIFVICQKTFSRFSVFALYQAQIGKKHIQTESLHGFKSAGVLEVVEEHSGSAYRAVYTVRFSNAVHVLHCFQKKSKKGKETPKHELELIKTRLKWAEEHSAISDVIKRN